MSADRVRSVVIDARERMGAYYRAEFVRLLLDDTTAPRSGAQELDGREFVQIVRAPHSEGALKDAFARLLKSNLRAIPVFGPTFTNAVLQHVPADRSIDIGEESHGGSARTVAIAIAAVALLLLGAAGERVFSSVRAQNGASPLPQAAMPIAGYATPLPREQKPTAALVKTLPPAAAAARVATPLPAPTGQTTPAAAAAPYVERARVLAAPAPSVRRPARSTPTPQPAQGIATIAIPAATPAPTTEPTSYDVSDMPDAYSDATPLPVVTAPPAAVPHKVVLKTPPPKPKKSWLKRTLNHFIDRMDPFKPE